MSRFCRRFVAVGLVAIWLLATQHCGLEAAGWFDAHAAASPGCCATGEVHCDHDGCEIVESRGANLPATTKVLPPQLAFVCYLICPNSIVPRAEVDRESWPDLERAVGWTHTWQFVQRAALPPRAPSNALV